jgi:hypothetical protein
MKLHHRVISPNSMFVSVCRTITLSVQPVCPIVLQGKLLLRISVQFCTATQLIPHLITRNPQALFVIFQHAGRLTYV